MWSAAATISTRGGSRSPRGAPDADLLPCVTVPCDARCCDSAEVPLLEADVARLAAHTGRPAASFVEAADGWRILRGTGLDGCVFRGPVEIDGRRVPGCTVHTARPSACRGYPFVLRADGDRVSVTRDRLCPFAADFPAPSPDLAERLASLERQLEEERAKRSHDGR